MISPGCLWSSKGVLADMTTPVKYFFERSRRLCLVAALTRAAEAALPWPAGRFYCLVPMEATFAARRAQSRQRFGALGTGRVDRRKRRRRHNPKKNGSSPLSALGIPHQID